MSNDCTRKKQTLQIKKYCVQGKNSISPEYVEQFIYALKQNDLDTTLSLLNSFPKLATLKGDFFTAPLILAGMHHNTYLMNHLLDLGACPRHARRQPEFKRMPVKSQTYIELICNFKARVLEQIHTMH